MTHVIKGKLYRFDLRPGNSCSMLRTSTEWTSSSALANVEGRVGRALQSGDAAAVHRGDLTFRIDGAKYVLDRTMASPGIAGLPHLMPKFVRLGFFKRIWYVLTQAFKAVKLVLK